MAVPVDVSERRQLCDLMASLGPEAPTLCEGWTTADLAAHLVLREHFRGSGDGRRAVEKAKGFDALLARLRHGPPLVPWQVPGARTLLNGFEYFVHHEDVRRANGMAPRTGMAEVDRLCWRVSGFLGRRLERRLRPYALALSSPGRAERRFGAGEAALLSGPPSEVALYLCGRRAAAEVVLGGPVGALEALGRADARL